MPGQEPAQPNSAPRRWWHCNAHNVALSLGVGNYVSLWAYDLADWLYRPLPDLPGPFHADVLHLAGLVVVLGVLGWMRRSVIRPMREVFAYGYATAQEHAAASKDGATVVRLPTSAWGTPDEATGTDTARPSPAHLNGRRRKAQTPPR